VNNTYGKKGDNFVILLDIIDSITLNKSAQEYVDNRVSIAKTYT
jgi:hypothetical protein